MTRHAYHILDVFTDTPYQGNPLAVVHEADDLDTAQCQAIAREFNLSETAFVLEPRDPVNTARLRIFTPTRELPFAGHPTVGSAILIATLRAPEMFGRQHLAIVLEEEIGLVECTVRRVGGKPRASFTLPRIPAAPELVQDFDTLATVLGLRPEQIGFDGHRPATASAGNPFVFVPLADQAAVGAIVPQFARWDEFLPSPMPRAIFAYTRGGEKPDASFHARMFAPEMGMIEDPATGSAAAAFAAVVTAFDRPADGDHTLVIEQGFEMGRPSLMTLGLEIERGSLVSASVGGGAVIVAEGSLR